MMILLPTKDPTMAATAAGGREQEAWQLLVESAELARWLSFRELMQIARLSRGFRRMFERALGFLWRSRGAACARAELSHVVKRAVSCGRAAQVRILVPLVVARNLETAQGAPEAQAGGVAPYLFDAIRLGHVAVVGALLEIGGPELPTATDGGESCLAVSVRFQRAGLVGALLEAAGPRQRELLVMSCLSNVDYADMSCLHYSVYRGDLVMTNALLGAAARAGALRELLLLATDSGDTCLHLAAEYCLLPRGPGVVQALLQAADRAGALLELLLRRSGPGESCLLIAASAGSVDVVNELLGAAARAGALRELLMLTTVVGDSCLYASVEEGRVAAMRTLLDAAGPARRELLLLTNAFGESCLHIGVEEGRVDVVQALLDAAGGARRELLLLVDGSGASCLYRSVERGDLAMARALLAAAGEDAPELLVLVRTAGDTCLHASARSGRADVARALLAAAGPRRHELLVLRAGAAPSALHCACAHACARASLETVQALLEAAGERKRELLTLACGGETCEGLSALLGHLAVAAALRLAATPARA
jgi:ankyrin repeat protein